MERISSSMTSGAVSGLTAGVSTSCVRDQQMPIGGMATNYTPGLSADYNISSFSQRSGHTHCWPQQRAGLSTQRRPVRSHSCGSMHRKRNASRNSPNTAYLDALISRLADENERRRRQDMVEVSPQSYYSQQPLKVELTEFYSRDNSKDHHTESYELVDDNILPNPVLRRGKKFSFAVRFDRTFEKQQDVIRLAFCFGPNPSVTKGTRVVLPVNWSAQHIGYQHPRDTVGLSRVQDSASSGTSTPGSTVGTLSSNVLTRRGSLNNDPLQMQQRPASPHGPVDRNDRVASAGANHISTTGRSAYGFSHDSDHNAMQNLTALAPEIDKWELSVLRQDGNTITFQLYIPTTTPVGMWHCWVETNRCGQPENRHDYKCKEDIYILFNPWCREDSVYLDSESSRKEYVISDHGKIWCGTWRQPKGRKWIYGQFDDTVLPACICLLERSGLDHVERGNPMLVCRAISSMINATADDDGLIVGRYDGEYRDGVAPHAWTGSIAILERFLTEGGHSVQYGQCWVFSGLVVTICRALGIPCRSVTNYVSAHDTPRNFTVDKFYDREGNEVPNGSDEHYFDSYWSFHVWNDVWMQRPDLPQGYGGWQIIDATPQEEAKSPHACGPASVEAVRRGEVGFSYDTPSIYCQLNAELCHFQEEENSDWGFVRCSSNQYRVGRKVVTKDPARDDEEGDDDLLDVTHEYKSESGAERAGAVAACRGQQRAQQYYEPPESADDVEFNLLDVDVVPYGQNFDCTMNIENKSQEDRTIWCVLTASSCCYTGAVVSRLRRAQGEFVVRAGQREVLKLHVAPQDYADKMANHGIVKVHAMALVRQTRQAWADEEDFTMHEPRLQVQVRGQPSVGQECAVMFSFQNPLSVPLTDCYFMFEGSGVVRPRQIQYRDVKPGEFVTWQEKFIPRRSGESKLVATFSSRQLDEIFGSAGINVQG